MTPYNRADIPFDREPVENSNYDDGVSQSDLDSSTGAYPHEEQEEEDRGSSISQVVFGNFDC